jgi:hypothetical protein
MTLPTAVPPEMQVRSLWDEERALWYFSIVDVVGVLTDSPDPSAYWRKLKQRLKAEGNETVPNRHGLKMTAADSKSRLPGSSPSHFLSSVPPAPNKSDMNLETAVGEPEIRSSFDMLSRNSFFRSIKSVACDCPCARKPASKLGQTAPNCPSTSSGRAGSRLLCFLPTPFGLGANIPLRTNGFICAHPEAEAPFAPRSGRIEGLAHRQPRFLG